MRGELAIIGERNVYVAKGMESWREIGLKEVERATDTRRWTGDQYTCDMGGKEDMKDRKNRKEKRCGF